jgi:hypothetical protein
VRLLGWTAQRFTWSLRLPFFWQGGHGGSLELPTCKHCVTWIVAGGQQHAYEYSPISSPGAPSLSHCFRGVSCPVSLHLVSSPQHGRSEYLPPYTRVPSMGVSVVQQLCKSGLQSPLSQWSRANPSQFHLVYHHLWYILHISRSREGKGGRIPWGLCSAVYGGANMPCHDLAFWKLLVVR